MSADGSEQAAADITEAELRVLRFLANGKTGPEIAEQLGCSPHTVSSHVRSIKAKLGQRTQAGVVAEAIRIGLLPADGSGAR